MATCGYGLIAGATVDAIGRDTWSICVGGVSARHALTSDHTSGLLSAWV